MHDRFGLAHDGYLGHVVRRNTWTTSGHEFFAQHRVLRYMDGPGVQQILTRTGRRALERFCDRLPELIPAMPAVLTHGDLWSGNLLSRDDGHVAVIDPAVSCAWAEVDLSMLWGCQRPPASQRFFDVYQELNPSPPGWAEPMPPAAYSRTAGQHPPRRRHRRWRPSPSTHPRSVLPSLDLFHR